MQLCTHPKNVDNSLVGVTCADLLRRCDNVKLCCRTATSGSADGLLSFLAAQGPCCRTITQVTSEACFAKWFRSTTHAAQSYRDTRKRVSHPSGGASGRSASKASSGSFCTANCRLIMTPRRSRRFPSLFVNGSAIMYRPGIQWTEALSCRALVHITATSICALRHKPAEPLRL